MQRSFAAAPSASPAPARPAAPGFTDAVVGALVGLAGAGPGFLVVLAWFVIPRASDDLERLALVILLGGLVGLLGAMLGAVVGMPVGLVVGMTRARVRRARWPGRDTTPWWAIALGLWVVLFAPAWWIVAAWVDRASANS